MSKEAKPSMALSVAIEEQNEDRSLSMRDAMIGAALNDGHSAADIAQMLGLTPQAIYQIQSRQREESLSPYGAGADQRAVITALEQFSDHVRFEELVSALIGDIDSAAIPLGGSGDQGRDAATPDSSRIFTVSLQRQWKRKVESDLKKIESHGYAPQRVFAITNRRVSPKAAKALVDDVDKKGIDLVVLDQKWLTAKLSEPRYLHLRSGILNIAPPRSRSFLSSEEYRALLDGRPHLAGLTVHFSGRQSESHRAIELLESEGVVLLTGAGGYGKTRLALELAQKDDGPWRFIDDDMPFTPESISELPMSARLVVVIDNAHRREDLGTLLNALGQLPKGAPRLVLLARPGYLDKLNRQIAASHIGALDATRTIEIGPLSWRTMVGILKEPPLKIDAAEQRAAIIRLAEGNPQIAVIAAKVAAERRSVVGLTGDELLQRYIAYLIPTVIPAGSNMRNQRMLLALLAALDGVENDDDELISEVAGLLRMSTGQARDGLEELAESGLVITDATRYRIKPDLLAEHVLFALTLTERWELTLDYKLIFERFGEKHLPRLVRAIGRLPSGLFDVEVDERLQGIERAIEKAAMEGPPNYAATLIRELSHGRPAFAQQQAGVLLKRIASSADKPDAKVVNLLREGAMRMTDFTHSWRLLLRLGAASADGDSVSRKVVGESMSEVYDRLPLEDAVSGVVLAAVQDSLVAETHRFWKKNPSGAASAVALAVKPMLKVTFESTRMSPDNPMAFELGGRILPDSPYTKAVVEAGGKLAAEVFPLLSPKEQLMLVETVGWAAHAVAGFPMAMGHRAPMPGRALLHRALKNVDRVLALGLKDLEMPVQKAVYDYLLKRERYRRKLSEEIEADGSIAQEPEDFKPIDVPLASKELEEYILLINNGQVGPPDLERETIREEHERRLAQAAQLAQALADSPNWRTTVDRWDAWWKSRLALEKEPFLGTTVGMVFEAFAQADPELGAELVDHLIATGSDLRGATTGSMIAVISSGSKHLWEKWLSADSVARATLARALSNFDEKSAAEPLRKLAFDEDEAVRTATTSALAFAQTFEKWRFDLSLEAVARYPDIEAVGQLLHMADEHTDGEAEFEKSQLKLIESAILATALSDGIDAYRLADSFRRAERQLPGLAMRWIWARLHQMDGMERQRDLQRLWHVDFLDEELGPIVSGAANAADLKRAVETFAGLGEHSPAYSDTAKVIGWIDPAAQEVTDLIVDLLEDPDRAWRARQHLMDLPLSDEDLDRRALAFATSLEEPLVPLLDLIAGTLPNSWSGSYVPHLENGLSTAERWAASGQLQLSEAGRQAVEDYKRRINATKAREEAEDREFEYR